MRSQRSIAAEVRLRRAKAVDRLDPNDLPNLVSERPDRPWNISALLILERGPLVRPDGKLDVERIVSAIEARIATVPRLRQRLRRPPFGLGIPYWSDDPNFDARRHIEVDELAGELAWRNVLLATEEILRRRLDRDLPLWRVHLIDGTGSDWVAMVIVLHHVLADGVGGLAVLASLVDPGPTTHAEWTPRPMPTRFSLLVDNLHSRSVSARATLITLRHPWALLRAIWTAYRDMFREPAATTSFNVPIGPLRRLGVATVPLQSVINLAHAHGATVNDVVLTALTGAVEALLTARDELPAEPIQVSIPMSLRNMGDAAKLGNQVAGIRIPLPLDTPGVFDRFHRIASSSITAKNAQREADRIRLFQAFWRWVAAFGLHNWFVGHQRVVNLFATNVIGPTQPVQILESLVQAVLPIPPLGGNIPIGLGVLSYAGNLCLVLEVDPNLIPESELLLTGLAATLYDLTGERVEMGKQALSV